MRRGIESFVSNKNATILNKVCIGLNLLTRQLFLKISNSLFNKKMLITLINSVNVVEMHIIILLSELYKT